MRVCTLLFALAIVASALLPACSAPPQYTVTDLGNLGGNWSTAYGINDLGQVVGQANLPTGYGRAFLWDSANGMRNLGTLSGGDQSVAYAINNAGRVVGDSTRSDGSTHGFYGDTTGDMHDLGTLPGIGATTGWSFARDVDDAGRIVGWGDVYTSNQRWERHAFAWQDGVFTEYPPDAENTESYAYAISETGQIAGSARYGASTHACTFNPLADLTPGWEFSQATDNNNLGHVLIDRTAGYSHLAYIWIEGVLGEIGNLGDAGEASAINDHCQVVGHRRTETGMRAFLWEDGAVADLNSLIPADSGWRLTYAYDINNAGQIVGHGERDGVFNAFLLTPVPEPSGLLALAGGLMILLGGMSRRRIRP